MDGLVTPCEKMADFWPEMTDFGAIFVRGGSNDISYDVFSISIIKNCIYNKGTLIFAKISAQNSQIRENFAWITFFSLWTVKLLFVIFGRLSYTFLKDKICNLSVQPVYSI